ncbi:MAG: TonB-dependent receptor [Gemmatimonadales bacterium]|nr:TonB-dependent receptor [Gemmatimonadales bacterium]
MPLTLSVLLRRIATAALLLAPPAVAAQETLDTASLPEIVVTATRYPVAPDSVAATVTVLRGEDLRAEGIRFVSEALRQVPGAQVVRGGSYGAATSLFVRGGESDYVKVLVDGIPLNQPGGTFDFSSLTTENVERIEILRGPGSVLYGSDAIAGVVQIVTRDGAGGVQLNAGGEGGTFGTAEWQVGALGGGGGVGWSASVSRLTTDGIYDFNNDYRNTAASGRVQIGAGAHTGAALTARYTDGKFHFPTDFTGVPVDQNQYNAEETTTLGLDLTHRLSEALEAQLLLGRNASDAEFVNPPDPPASSGGSITETRTERRTAEARAQLRGPAGVRGLAGVSYDDQHQESRSEFDGFADAPFGADRDNWGFYLQASGLALPKLQLTAGGRLDENERFGSFWTYRASALAFAAAATRVRASVGTGFKEPSFFENFSTSFTRGNPELQPERSFSVEGGVEQDLAGGRVALAVTGFVQRFRDLIQYTPVTSVPEDPNFFNIAGADASGVEASLRVRPSPSLEGSVSYTWLHSEVTDAGFDSDESATFVEGERLLRRPTNAVTLRAGYGGEGRLRLGAALNWIGDRDDLRFAQFPEPSLRVELPAYATVDLHGRLTVLRPGRGAAPGLDLTARVENLFDEEYQQAASYPSPRRAIFLGVATHVR